LNLAIQSTKAVLKSVKIDGRNSLNGFNVNSLKPLKTADEKSITGIRGSQDNADFLIEDKTMWALIKLHP